MQQITASCPPVLLVTAPLTGPNSPGLSQNETLPLHSYRSAAPLFPRHLTTPVGRVRSRSRARCSFRLTPLRHLPSFHCGRSRSQPCSLIHPICHPSILSFPLGGCRCALRSVTQARANQRTERHARLAAVRLCAQASRKQKAVPAPCRTQRLYSRGTCLRFAASGAAPVRCCRSGSPRCGTCPLPSVGSGAARCRAPLFVLLCYRDPFPRPPARRLPLCAVAAGPQAVCPLRSAALTLRCPLSVRALSPLRRE